MLEHKRAALRGVALHTSLVVAEQGGAATPDALRQIRSAAFHPVALVRIVAIGASHLAFEHGMMMRQLERRPHLGVTGKAGRGRFARVNDLAPFAAARDMETARSVTTFAAHALGVVSLRFQPRVRRGPESFYDRFMTGRAFFRADEFRARNTGRRHDRAARFEVAAGKQNEGERGSSADKPPESFAFTN